MNSHNSKAGIILQNTHVKPFRRKISCDSGRPKITFFGILSINQDHWNIEQKFGSRVDTSAYISEYNLSISYMYMLDKYGISWT